MGHRAKLGAALAIALLVAGSMASITVASAGAPRASTTYGPTSVPWAEVGPGWVLGVWSTNPPLGPGQRPPHGYRYRPPQDVYLVSPEGVRYLIVHEPNNLQSVLAWSGDGRRALQANEGEASISQIDLETGKAFDRFKPHTSSSNFVDSVTYTRPDGLALLITYQRGENEVLQRYTLTGKLLMTYPSSFGGLGTFDGEYTESANGTEIAFGARRGIALVGNDGAILAQYRVPHTTYCQPTRWWNATVILAACGSAGPSRLFEIHVDTGAIDDLTASPKAPDFGDLNAWSTLPGIYVQTAGGCGYLYIAKLGTNHRTKAVSIPGVNSGESQYILGSVNHELAVFATVACGSGESVLWWNPTLDTSSVILGPPIMAGSVENAFSFPGT